jgi:hypothetical protein
MTASTIAVPHNRRVRRRVSNPNVDIAFESDDTWLYSDSCLDTLIRKYDYRKKALEVEKKRRLQLAEKIVLEAVNIYCAKTVSTTLYDSQEF